MSFLGLFAGGACGPASALLRGFTRSPLVTRWRNPGAPKKLDRSNKGKQQWFKGRGVGLHGALNKQGTRAHPSAFSFRFTHIYSFVMSLYLTIFNLILRP
jgi:hypothetical protein